MNLIHPIALLTILVVTTNANSGEAPSSFPDHKRPVMTWVPRYAVEKCNQRFMESYGGAGMSDALTHVGLQFWTPTKNGDLNRTGKGETTSDAAIKRIREWGQTNGVRILLCVYQIGDWELARSAFRDNRDRFIESLLTEVDQLGLDGVDIDFEGRGRLNEDKDAFVAFVRELAGRLHRDNRHLTVDSYSYIWNAPNQTWWPDLLPHVDGLTTMGYDRIGSKDTNWCGYAAQKAAAGAYSQKLMIGLPTHKGEWREGTLADHLMWLVADGEVGVALWDAQLRNEEWRKPGIWKSLCKIRRDLEAPQ